MGTMSVTHSHSSLLLLATLFAAFCGNALADGAADCAAHRRVLNSIRRRLPPVSQVKLPFQESFKSNLPFAFGEESFTKKKFEEALKNVLETSQIQTEWAAAVLPWLCNDTRKT